MNARFKTKFKLSTIGWIFILPATLLLLLTKFWPIIRALVLSFQSGVGLNTSFVGAKNYIRMLHDNLLHTSIFNTFFYLLLQVPIMLIIAIILAVILNDSRLKLKGFFRTAIFLPCATSLVSYAIIFRSLFARDGFINLILMKTNIINNPINWLSSPWPARIVIIIALTWRWTGYNMIFYLAGLQGIDPSIYEAAKIDGASAFTSLRKITIPLLKPMILLTSITSISGTLQLFDETKNLTNGGPANSTISISQYIYNLSFAYSPQFGYAAAVSFLVLIMVAILSFTQMKVGDRR
ncbi:MAG: sugar ABC transporter permease [Clostridiales bacterium]|nr:sugar ABC transporter permease [Clostridiales bacterium]